MYESINQHCFTFSYFPNTNMFRDCTLHILRKSKMVLGQTKDERGPGNYGQLTPET